MWEDKCMYWAWRSKESPTPIPTTKELVYASIVYKYPKITMTICCGVYDDDKFTPLHQDEIQWHKNNGADIIYGKV